MHVCECVSECVCFLRPCRGGKFSRAIIRPQITALHSQKSPLLGPHQQHNEGSKKPSTLEKCRNLIPLNFKKRRGPSSESSLGIYFTDDQKTDSFVLLSTVHAASLSASVGSAASAVSFLVKYIILYFHTCDYRCLSGALHLSLSIVRQVNMSSHANDTADRMKNCGKESSIVQVSASFGLLYSFYVALWSFGVFLGSFCVSMTLFCGCFASCLCLYVVVLHLFPLIYVSEVILHLKVTLCMSSGLLYVSCLLYFDFMAHLLLVLCLFWVVLQSYLHLWGYFTS